MIRFQLQQQFKTRPQKLWELMVDPDHYRFWSKAFHEGSEFVGDWTKGSKMRFVVRDNNDVESGMLSEIAECDYPEYLSIRHFGLVMNGIEDFDSPMTRGWIPSFENYRLTSTDDEMTIFYLEQDVPKESVDEFTNMWNKSFEYMAQLLEANRGKPSVITLREQSTHSPRVIWEKLVTPEKVMTWNFASDDWHCPQATIDLRVDGEFHWEMAAKDGSMSFDFGGTYTQIEPEKRLHYILDDGRKVRITLIEKPFGCIIEERFEAEEENSLNLQRMGWQSILRNLTR